MKKGLTNSLGWLILETQKSRACVELRQICTVLTSLIITICCCVSQCDVTSRTVLFCLTNPKDSSESWSDETLWKELVLFLVFRWAFIAKIRLRENASGWSAPKFDSPVLNWRTDPWHQPWCTLHVWISCPSNSTNEFGRNLGDAQIGDMEVKCPLFHSCLLQKKRLPLGTSTGKVTSCHPPTPDLSLASFNLPCDSRITARTFRMISVLGWLAPSCASWPASALRCSSSAWRLEVAPLRHYKLAT